MDYIAIDIGASSGRFIHTNFDEGCTFELDEIHRFKNSFTLQEGNDRWHLDHLVHEILTGLEKVKKLGIETCFIGIDTWGVDYGLIGHEGNLLSQPISYRDDRTKGALELFEKEMTLERLYKKTGIQIQPFNTVFQLLVENRELLSETDRLLLMPDLLGYLLTGKAVMEETNASTMQLLNLKTRDWDTDILEVIGVEKELFPPLTKPGTVLGKLQQERLPTYDLPNGTFITVCSHDTASAVVGTPVNEEQWAYISSGTWSLLGVEKQEGLANERAFDYNYTNEWGYGGSIRFLKNIMGMWLIQEVARMQNYQYSYAELATLASKEVPFQQLIDINDPRFLNPQDMIEELQDYCRETKQKVPLTAGELARCVYDNLALCYGLEMKRLEEIHQTKINKLHIVGGGGNNDLLNQLTADICQIEVEAGPSEATAIGNLMVQMIATNGYQSLREARMALRKVIDLKSFKPQKNQMFQQKFQEYKKMIEKRGV